MQERVVEPKPEKVSVLKVDKDCHVSSQLEREYVQQTVEILRKHHLKVLSITATRTLHGRHYYIRIDPPVSPRIANDLQYLLGDDSRRVDFNRARVISRLNEWSKLFEDLGRRLVTLYRHPSCGCNRTKPQRR
jgi:hypothetical protein